MDLRYRKRQGLAMQQLQYQTIQNKLLSVSNFLEINGVFQDTTGTCDKFLLRDLVKLTISIHCSSRREALMNQR